MGKQFGVAPPVIRRERRNLTKNSSEDCFSGSLFDSGLAPASDRKCAFGTVVIWIEVCLFLEEGPLPGLAMHSSNRV